MHFEYIKERKVGDLPLNTVAQASLFATTKARADGRLDALVPAPVGESVDGRLNAGLGLLCVEEGLQLCDGPS